MNALFIGPYRQNDGWGMASRAYIKAIATQIPNISARPIYYTNNLTNNIDKDITEYEHTLYKNYDVVFQKALPHSISINKKIKKNVGLFVLETNDISQSVCIHNLNNLDEICVPSTQEAKCLTISKVTTPIKVISQPIDIDLYEQHKDHKLELPNHISNTFKFYFIGEYIERKNLHELVIAFNLAFDNTDNVSLIIKTSIPGQDSQQSKKIIQEQCNQIKSKLRTRSLYKQEFIICDRLTNEDMVKLHNSCDCLVMPSCGEAFCRPAAEALICGNTPIVTDNTGMTDFINKDNGFIVNSRKHPVILDQRTLSDEYDIYTANEYWYKPNIYSLIESMKKVYELSRKDKKAYEQKKQIGIDSKDLFSYANIGKKICD